MSAMCQAYAFWSVVKPSGFRVNFYFLTGKTLEILNKYTARTYFVVCFILLTLSIQRFRKWVETESAMLYISLPVILRITEHIASSPS